jgi:predicted lysophospholipase L1 biosynthesis ABC-type transport system permease subunit
MRTLLDPAAFGLSFVDLERTRAEALRQGMDFGALFLGFSGLLVIAALLLLGLVVALNVTMRQEEIATLRALGFAPRRIRRLFAAEHALVALAGGGVGAVGGVALQAAALGTLSTVWSDVAGSLPMALVVRPGTVIAGTAAGALVSFGAAYLVLWPALRGSVLDAFTRSEEVAVQHARTRVRRCYGGWVALLFAVAAVVLALRAGTGRDPATAGAFFGSGALLLCAALSFAWYALAHVGVAREGRRFGPSGLAWRDLGRRRGRSLATIGILAFGVFMFFGVTVFRRDRLTAHDDPASGTGGFALVGESAVAVTHDLDTPDGRRFYGLTDADLADVHVVNLRVRQGDDASCRSLARAQVPTVVGVDPRALSGRFSFLQTASSGGDPWDVLRPEAPEDEATPAVIDQATMWTLGKGLGDEVALVDEHGRPFTARIRGVIDNAVLHGHLIVSETAFEKRYPSEAGYRLFLVDAPPSRVDAVAARLSRQLEDRGLSLERTEARLNATNAVENTYLGIFQALGGLALLLGSVGLALVVARNTIERRAEFALLGAVGFARRRVVRLVATEHAVLLGVGLLAGVAAAVLSILPALQAPGARVATPRMGLVLLALGAGGMLWTLLAARFALGRRHLEALRRE